MSQHGTYLKAARIAEVPGFRGQFRRRDNRKFPLVPKFICVPMPDTANPTLCAQNQDRGSHSRGFKVILFTFLLTGADGETRTRTAFATTPSR